VKNLQETFINCTLPLSHYSCSHTEPVVKTALIQWYPPLDG